MILAVYSFYPSPHSVMSTSRVINFWIEKVGSQFLLSTTSCYYVKWLHQLCSLVTSYATFELRSYVTIWLRWLQLFNNYKFLHNSLHCLYILYRQSSAGGSVDLEKLKKQCGVGVVVTHDAVEELVKRLVAKHKEEMTEQR